MVVDRLKTKVAIRQSIIWGVVLSVVLFLVFMYNISTMYHNIEAKLDEISHIKYNKFFEDDFDGFYSKNRDTMAVFVSSSGALYLSDITLFTEYEIREIADKALTTENYDGFVSVGDRKVAFRQASEGTMGDILYLCDCTEEFNRNVRTLLIIIAAGVIGVIAISLISIWWSRKNLAPVEIAFEKQQELVANASHELKTPITIINTDLSILSDSAENFTEEQKKWLENIGIQVNRMSNMVTEMLTLAKIESSGKNQIKEEVNLSNITEGVILASEVLAFENNIKLETEIKSGVCIVANAVNIEKLIYILVDNGLKYTPKGGKLNISVNSDRKRAILKVRNSGAGIKKDDIPKLFDRFYRVDEAHSGQSGFGLGLAIAKSIVDVSGGKIGIDSVEGEYTEFIVIFREKDKNLQ